MPPTAPPARRGLSTPLRGLITAAAVLAVTITVTAAGAASAAPARPAAHASTAAADIPPATSGITVDGRVRASLVSGAAAKTTINSAAPHSAAQPQASGSAGVLPWDLRPYTAADLQAAYKLPSALLGARQTVAIVNPYDDPTAASDLAQYRSGNGLSACNTAFPCFRQVNQDGQSAPLPVSNKSWALNAAAATDMVSAACPNCSIILVEADDATMANLAIAENEAASLGANVIVNTWGMGEFDGEQAYAADFDHPGIAITAPVDGTGFGGIDVPAVYQGVTAVGSTVLWPDPGTARGWAEALWSVSGSGCSVWISKPAWQHDSLCGMRTVADVSAVGGTPVAIYDSGDGGWLAVTGTPLPVGLIGGVYALAGNTATIGPGASWIYSHRQALFDVTTDPALSDVAPGSNGDCGGSYLCTAVTGYDGPTGNGTPDGIGGF